MTRANQDKLWIPWDSTFSDIHISIFSLNDLKSPSTSKDKIVFMQL